MARIASLGSGLQDIYLIDHDDLVPTEIGSSAIFGKVLVGEKVDIDKVSYEVGGGGLNSAITFSRYGHEAIFLGNLSHDPAGMAIVRKMDQEGIDSSYIQFLERRSTGTSVILLNSKSGERTILTCRGASEQFGNFDEGVLDMICPDWLYITSLRGDLLTLERFLKKANKLGINVMFNPGVNELTSLFKYISILIVNKSEAAQLVPGKVLSELLYHLSAYVPTVIITDGPMGGIATNGEETYRFGLYGDIKVKDATGAGDAFGSGFLASASAGKPFRTSLIFASANSTGVVSKLGANRGILSGNEKLHQMPIQRI